MTRFVSLAGVLVLASCSTATGPYINDPALCQAPAAEQEQGEITLLAPTRIGNHAMTCRWDDPLGFAPDSRTALRAVCDDGGGVISRDLVIAVDAEGGVQVLNPDDSPAYAATFRQCPDGLAGDWSFE
ncbi:MAG: hypothetical protein HLUCCA08_10430 [Rhodobacteraceae bacterium HLUCCA08]|nr:MAG: hypothetical protein HLUCCA08_10430 [Rhodobacteraceae bacterium HLUCCA08]